MLLVVMVLLALMSLMGLTLVMVTAQGRLSALAASRKGLQSTHDSQELTSATTQVVTGSNDPNSSFGAHGLLEDLYGLPQFFGRIAPGTPVLPIGETVVGTSFLAGGNNGALVQFVVIPAAPSGAAGLGQQSTWQYVLPPYSGAFCGQVITMLTGPAAGNTARVVGYYFNPGAQMASIQASSFGGVVPQPGDEFMINGRPFSGTGFGLDLTKFQTPGTGLPWVAPYTQAPYSALVNAGNTGPLLTAAEVVPNVSSPPDPLVLGMPYAYLPNHARIGLTSYAPTAGGTYWDLAGPGGANETYDAPDFQNMMLAMHYWNSGSGVITPIPSMHRPELVGWYHYQSQIYGNPAISMANPDMRRKVILRPEPMDHNFVDTNGNGVWDAREPFQDMDGSLGYTAGDVFLDLNNDGVWTPGDTDYSGNTFNPITGCWYIKQNGEWARDVAGGGLDVDNDQDGVPDSIWIEGGLPVHTEADGTLTKNLVAVLCIDLDGKINLNAHGNLAQLDVFRYPYNPYTSANDVGATPNPWDPTDSTNTMPVLPNTLAGPLAGLSAATPGSTPVYVPLNALLTSVDFNQRTVPVGQGYGPADVNLVHLFRRSHGNAALNYYRVFLQGFDGYPNAPSSVPPVDGKLGESTRLTLFGVPGFIYPGVFPPGEYVPPWNATPGLTWTQSYMNGPRPGWSQWFDPFATALLVANSVNGYWVNDPVALARFSDIRPNLLEPGLKPATPFFFDFLGTGTVGHQPTGHGTPSDLHSRGFLMTDLAGHPYYAGTAALPWQTTPTGTLGWSSVMTESQLNPVTNNYPGFPFLQSEYVQNEGVDTPYEFDPRQTARQGGQNTGNSISGIPDFATVDRKISPTEYEGIARYHEWGASGSANSSSLVSRLNNLETAASYLATGNTGAKTTQLGDDKVRLALTSDSWDLPVPNIALTPQQMRDVTQLVNYFGSTTLLPLGNASGATSSLNLANVSLAELARARIFADNYNPTTATITGQLLNATPSFADLALFGNMKNTQQSIAVFPTLNAAPVPGVNPNIPVWPLLSAETVLGMRLDVNRLLGNGVDDNGNGVVDEPLEAIWQGGAQAGFPYGEALAYPYSRINTSLLGPVGQQNPNVAAPGSQNNAMNMLGVLDLNNDGFYSELANATGLLGVTSVDPQLTTSAAPVYLPGDPTFADMRARQLLARHLYCLMMLLLDDRPYLGNTQQLLMAQIFNATNPIPATQYPNGTPGVLSYATLAGMHHEQAAYVLAQWAINVVDFRDRDSIMTPFEFDLYPFRADDPAYPNVTWNVDDIIDPIGVSTGAPGCSLQPGSLGDDNDPAKPWRGLVWGCERPELLMTETVAFHDRGTADTAGGQNINDPQQNPATGKDTVTTNNGAMPYDKDFDQVRRPRGSMIVELFNPTNYWDAPQRDLQTNNLQNNLAVAQPQLQPWDKVDGNGNQGYGVNLAQVAVGQPFNNTFGPPSSPVWRIVIAYSPWQTKESMCYNANANATPALPAGVTGQPIGGMGRNLSPQGQTTPQQIDPRVPILPATAIHRVVYFTPFQQGFLTGSTIPANAVPGPGSVVADVLLNNSFFADPEIFAFNQASGIAPATPTATLLLPPGQYALVGPANQDVAGSGNYYVFAGQNTTTTNANVCPWKLQLGNVPSYNTTAYLYGPGGTAPAGSPYGAGYNPVAASSTTIKPAIGVPIQTNWFQNVGGKAVYLQHNHLSLTGGSAGAGTVSTTLRMSVSEPEHGYPIWQNGQVQPIAPSAANLALLQDDATYYSLPGTPYQPGQTGGPTVGITSFPQHPFDSGQGNPQAGNAPYLQFSDLPNPYVAPGGTTSTTLGYTVLYLQRLANPLQAWDAKMNPYITVDSMPVDLTAYTGEPTAGGTITEMATTYSVTAGPNPPTGIAAGNNWVASPGTATTFDTRRRGYDPKSPTNTLLADQMVPNIWTPLPTNLGNLYSNVAQYGNQYNKGTYSNPMPSNYSATAGYSTLGYINWEYTNAFYPAGVYTGDLAPVGAGSMQGFQFVYNGDPLVPFPWMPWNNRPYISQYELMLVPASSPSSQLQDFGMLGWQAIPPKTPTAMNEYSPTQPTAGLLPAAQFMQLLNFFNSQQIASSNNLMPNLYRIFEFLQVPSRYTGTQDMLDPSQFTGDDAVFATQGMAGNTSHLFHTPFNWLPKYREPGKINLNTVFDPIVFKALADDYPGTLFGQVDPTTQLGAGSLWQKVFLSRQGFAMPTGYTQPPNPVAQFFPVGNPGYGNYATYFANVFRPDGATAFSPPTTWNPPTSLVPGYQPIASSPLMQTWSYPGTPTGQYSGVNATLLRPSSSGLALFDDTSFDTTNAGATYASTGTGITPPYSFRHAGRDPTFQYQMFTRLGNTTTNRSNVYAIWVTLGKFEVQSVAVGPQNPDGYKLVKPYLDATGKQVMTRGFYIFDRSIPMGFQRGQDVNSERGMLVERVLQLPQ